MRRIAYELLQQDQGTHGRVENQRTQPIERKGPRVVRAVPGGHSVIVGFPPIALRLSRKYNRHMGALRPWKSHVIFCLSALAICR